MELEVEITKEDFHAFTQKVAESKGGQKNMCVVLNLLFGVAIAYTGLHLYHTGIALNYELSNWIAGPGVIILLVSAWLTFSTWLSRQFFQPLPNQFVLGKKTYEFSSSGIKYTGNNHVAQYGWPAILSDEESDNQFFLFLDANAALIIPKLSFSSEEEFESFKKMISKFRRQDS